MTCKHAKQNIPATPEEAATYEFAKKYIDFAKEAGYDNEEVHELFKYIMTFNVEDLKKLDPANVENRFKSAVQHAKQAKADNKSTEEIQTLFRKVLFGTGTCPHKKQ